MDDDTRRRVEAIEAVRALSKLCADLCTECLVDTWALKFRPLLVVARFMTKHPEYENRGDIIKATETLRLMYCEFGRGVLIEFRDGMHDDDDSDEGNN